MPNETVAYHAAVTTTRVRYVLKADPHSSHTVMLRWLGDGHGRRLLDVGAADGLLARELTARGWRVTAIEADAAQARAGVDTCERMLVADLDQATPALDGDFDAIVFGDVLEHLREPDRVLTELTRALAPGAPVVVSVPNVAHLWIRLSLAVGRFEYAERGILDRTHLRFFTRRSLLALLTRAGLRVERLTATPVPLYQVVPSRLHGRTLAVVHGASAAVARVLPRLLAYQFVVLARRA